MLSENAFKEMLTLADKSSDFRFSSGIQVYFWTQRAPLVSAQAQRVALAHRVVGKMDDLSGGGVKPNRQKDGR